MNTVIHKKIIVTLLLCACVVVGAFGYERRIPSDALTTEQFDFAKKIVEEAEAYRGFADKDFAYVTEVLDTLDTQIRSTALLDVQINWYKDFTRDSIVHIKTGNSAGTIILQKGVNMWFYKQGTANAFRISPAQRLLGGASYADVSSTNYSQFYDPIDMEEVTIGKTEAYKVKLKKVENGVAYSNIDFYIAKKGNRPIKADFFTPSGKKLKTMYFRDFGLSGGKMLTREWVIVDALNPKAVTFIRVKDIFLFKAQDITFTVEGIKNI